MKRHVLAIDLKPDVHLIDEYDRAHLEVYPEVLQNLRDCGVVNMSIYRVENRLTMIMDADDTFSFDLKHEKDKGNKRLSEWESMMSKLQIPIEGTSVKYHTWAPMKEVFTL